MMFHPYYLDRITQARLLARFVPTLDSSEDAANASDFSRHAIIVRNTKQFQLVEKYLDYGLSFNQVSHVMADTK